VLEHLRQRVIQTLASARSLTLSTFGPAGLQSSRLPCEAADTTLFVLIPRTSDHLFNLEANPAVVVVSGEWNLRGAARVVLPEAAPPGLQITHTPEAQWNALVEIRPSRVNLLRVEPSGYSETIDMD
jgi:hypothetical protein